jgi:hypothetical protein
VRILQADCHKGLQSGCTLPFSAVTRFSKPGCGFA